MAAGDVFTTRNGSAGAVGIATGATVADALVGRGVGAVTVQSTTRTADGRRGKRWHAQHISIAHKVGQTLALAGGEVAPGADATLALLTAVHAAAAHAELSTLAGRLLWRALRLRVAPTAGPGVAVEAAHALADAQVLIVDDALGVDAAEDVGTGRDASLDEVVAAAGVAWLALTAGGVVEGDAVGVRATDHCRAGVNAHARVLLAGSVLRAVAI